MYCTVFSEIVVLTKYPWMPVSITVAFEKGILNTCKHEFKENKNSLMLFSFKTSPFQKIKKNIASRTGYISDAQIDQNTHVGS
ncbi:hypothetical protein HZS_3412 [Henneguya salminicola]|nr:hypothetical protein HZS_3412 [Henneguya salminicola]